MTQENPNANPMPPLTPLEYDELKESIRQHGVLKPIHVGDHLNPIDGHHRKQIAKELKIKYSTVYIHGLTLEQEQALSIALNTLGRVNMTDYQRLKSFEARLAFEIIEADKRMKAGHPTTAGGRVGEAAEVAAKAVGFSATTARRSRRKREIVQASSLGEELMQQLEAGEITLDAAYKQVSEVEGEAREMWNGHRYLMEKQRALEAQLDEAAEEREAVANALSEQISALENERHAVEARLEALAEQVNAEHEQVAEAAKHDLVATLVAGIVEGISDSEDASLPLAALKSLVYNLEPGMVGNLPKSTPADAAKVQAVTASLGGGNGRSRDPVRSAMMRQEEAQAHLKPIYDLDHATEWLFGLEPAVALDAWDAVSSFEPLSEHLTRLISMLTVYQTRIEQAKEHRIVLLQPVSKGAD